MYYRQKAGSALCTLNLVSVK